MALSELEQKLREQLKRCDLGLSKGCRGEDNPDGRCQYCDDPYCCLVDTFIRDCLGMPYPWGDEEEVDWSDLGPADLSHSENHSSPEIARNKK